MRHIKTTMMPVIVGALGMIKKVTDKHIDKILGSYSLYEIQKVTFSEIAHLGEYNSFELKINT